MYCLVPRSFRRHELFQRPASHPFARSSLRAAVSGDTNFSNGLHRFGSWIWTTSMMFQATRTFPTACISTRQAAMEEDHQVSGDTNFSNGLHPRSTRTSRRISTSFRRHELFQRPASLQRAGLAVRDRVSGDTNFSNGLHPTGANQSGCVDVFQATRTFPTACIEAHAPHGGPWPGFRRHELFQRPASAGF